MNPIKNKKDLETIINDIRNLAYSYLEKYSPSKQQLKTYLFKKLVKINQKTTTKKELFNLIDTVILSLIDQKLLSDKYYSDAKSKALLKKGHSLKEDDLIYLRPNHGIDAREYKKIVGKKIKKDTQPFEKLQLELKK